MSAEAHLTNVYDFALNDPQGKVVRLVDGSALTASVVVFYRGRWCPYCRRYLCKLQKHFDRLTARGERVMAISPEPQTTSRLLTVELGLTYPLLCDSDGSVIDRYGVRNGFNVAAGNLPHAAVFVFDTNNRLRFQSIDRNYKKRTTIRTMLGVLDDLAGTSSAVEVYPR